MVKEFENREGAIPRLSPELENLAKYLLVPRKPRGFKKVDGWVEPINSDSDMPITPAVTVGIPYADLVGLRSGRRAGLLSVESAGGKQAIKLKGCRILSAFSKKAEGPYRRVHIFQKGNTGGHPEGGHTLSAVEREIDNTLFFNELFTGEGFSVPYKPEAIIHYGVMFNSNGESGYAEELAASVMHVKGDTRLAELYRLKAIDVKVAKRVAYRLGLMAGAQKRITNGFYWKDSESTGNYVVFLEGNQLHLGTVDLEDTVPYENVDISEEEQYLSTISHYPSWFSELNKRDLSGAPDLERHTIAKIFGSMNRSSLATVEGERTRPNSTAKYTAPAYFGGEFIKGFKLGYKNPDRREPYTSCRFTGSLWFESIIYFSNI